MASVSVLIASSLRLRTICSSAVFPIVERVHEPFTVAVLAVLFSFVIAKPLSVAMAATTFAIPRASQARASITFPWWKMRSSKQEPPYLDDSTDDGKPRSYAAGGREIWADLNNAILRQLNHQQQRPLSRATRSMAVRASPSKERQLEDSHLIGPRTGYWSGKDRAVDKTQDPTVNIDKLRSNG
ncbi:hypothetical protein NL676_005491 [Syzygium grande]|nr:hypothetical protein NL676_005491 [Syzygium grande]